MTVDRPRISEDDDGRLDDFYVENATVHFEALDTCAWYVSVLLADGRMWQINCGACREGVEGVATLSEEMRIDRGSPE